MTDRATREAERQASTDPESAARVLVERVRAGTLDRERLRVAAYCGHEASRGAEPWNVAFDCGGALAVWENMECLDLPTWLTGLATCAPRLDVEVMREERCRKDGCRNGGRPPGYTRDCLSCQGTGVGAKSPWPSGEWLMLRAALVACGVALEKLRSEFRYVPHGDPALAAHLALAACKRFLDSGLLSDREAWDLALDGLRDYETPLGRVRGTHLFWVPRIGDRFEKYIQAAVRMTKEADVREAITKDLIEWALA